MFPYPSEVTASDVAGEQSIVTNAMEARWHDVDQEPADELIRRYRHGLVALPTLASIVFPAKRYAAFIVRDESRVGDGDSVGIARQVSEHSLRSGKRTLGINYPVDLSKWCDVCNKALGISEIRLLSVEVQVPVTICRLELFQEQASKQTRQHPYG